MEIKHAIWGLVIGCLIIMGFAIYKETTASQSVSNKHETALYNMDAGIYDAYV